MGLSGTRGYAYVVHGQSKLTKLPNAVLFHEICTGVMCTTILDIQSALKLDY